MKSRTIVVSQRMERKYQLNTIATSAILSKLLLNPLAFSKIYPQRWVNTLYFDTPSLSNLTDSINGAYTRVKPRVRWYGRPSLRMHDARLELKLKQGNLGTKMVQRMKLESRKLKSFNLDSDTLLEMVDPKFSLSKISLQSTNPVLSVSYQRQYFADHTGSLRLTIDTDIRFQGIFSQKTSKLRDTNGILELKYEPQFEDLASKASGNLPFTLVRNSKYLIGMSRFMKIL